MTDPANDFSTNFTDALIAAGGVGLLQALEHVGLWPIVQHIAPGDELSPLVPYTLGTATIGLGLTALAIRWKDPRLVMAFWLLAGASGAAVGGLRLYRHWLRVEMGLYEEAGHGAGLIDGTRSTWNVIERRSPTHPGD